MQDKFIYIAAIFLIAKFGFLVTMVSARESIEDGLILQKQMPSTYPTQYPSIVKKLNKEETLKEIMSRRTEASPPLPSVQFFPIDDGLLSKNIWELFQDDHFVSN